MSKKTPSIQRRLFKLFAFALPVLLLAITALTAVPIYQSVNTDDDEDLHALATMILTYSAEQPQPEQLHQFLSDNDLDEYTNYILWDATGRVLIDHSDNEFAFQPLADEFIDTANPLSADAWRVYYAIDESTGNRVAVGQPWDERFYATSAILWEQLALLLLILPLLLALLFWGLRRGLRPLHTLTEAIGARRPDDLTPIAYQPPVELQPLVQALNTLLGQVSELLDKEQRFIADASHELRSPLTAIKVQTELLSLTPHSDDQAEHLHAIERVTDRATHLIEQLLTLARLDPRQALQNAQTIDWLSLSETALQSVSLTAREKNVRLKRLVNVDNDAVLPLQGEPTLLTLLLRNLLDNAIRYGGENNAVTLILDCDRIIIRDHGKGIAPQDLARVRERFYRPAGQGEIGSGLGLSIVERIAELHGLGFSLDNHADGGVVAYLTRERNA